MIDQWHYAALRWYFCEYESEIAVRGFDASGAIGGTQSRLEAAMSWRMIRAHRRAKRIESALFAIPRKHQRVLRLVHEQRNWPSEKCAGVRDDLKGIVCRLRPPPDGEGGWSRGRDLHEVQNWAERRFQEAHDAFAKKVKVLKLGDLSR